MLRRYFIVLILSGFAISAYTQSRDLDFYLKQAVQNSPLLNDYRNQVKSSYADSLLIRAAKKPLVEAKSQLLYSPAYHNF